VWVKDGNTLVVELREEADTAALDAQSDEELFRVGEG
jgi:hypothetical protein